MESICSYFPTITANQQQQFGAMKELYSFWNEKVNVISRKDIENFDTHHLLHSLAIARVKSFEKNHTILDVGTGGGFPGIPLAVLFPEVQFVLVDSIGKKIQVVQEIAKELGLKNVVAKQNRAEELPEKFDFIVSRAVTQMPKFVEWVKNKMIRNEGNGIYYLKGGNLQEELKDFPKAKIYSISDYFEHDFFETKKVVYLPL